MVKLKLICRVVILLAITICVICNFFYTAIVASSMMDQAVRGSNYLGIKSNELKYFFITLSCSWLVVFLTFLFRFYQCNNSWKKFAYLALLTISFIFSSKINSFEKSYIFCFFAIMIVAFQRFEKFCITVPNEMRQPTAEGEANR